MLAADLEALRRQKIAQHPAACERILEMQLIHPSHDGKIGVRDGPRPVIDASPADAQHLCLARDRQIVGTVYHRFALSRPALPSAPSKKSFSSVSSPIFAWSDLISTRGTSGSERVPDPNTAAAPSWSSDFHCVIWLGWTSNFCAKSASVFSPLMAASATFALKAGVWFRRGRLLIISPVQQPSWLLSGRNPTYPIAQILQATSQDLSVSPAQSGGDGAEPCLGHGHHLHSDGAGLRLSHGRCGLVQLSGSRLASIDHHGGGILHRGA